MKKENFYRPPEEQEGKQSAVSWSAGKKKWQEPKLAFVEPKLTKHGNLKAVTGFFGPFSP